MDDLPEPLTPPECDLRGMEWMPLHGHKLYGSDFDAIASDTEYRAAQRLWWAAWQQQVPAASMPDDDRILAHAAGFSRDLKGWAKIRKVALHAFVKCSDGRLYHRFLAPEAIVAWDRRVKERDRKAAYRAKRDGTDGENTNPVPRDKPQDNGGTECAPDAEFPILSHVDSDGDRTIKKERAELRSDAAGATSGSQAEVGVVQDARELLWRHGLKLLRGLTGKTEPQARSLIGKWLRVLEDDCSALGSILVEATEARPVDPIPWITAAVDARKKPKYRNGFLQLIANEGVPSASPQPDPVTAFLEAHARG